jgi:hypothetical protein
MRLIPWGIVLAVSIPAFAASHASVLARHRPMHPDDTQTVTFEATATEAKSVTLSYTRYTLATASDGTHVKMLAEPEMRVRTCNASGGAGTIACTHTMRVPFPASSLVTYTARATDLEGNVAAETYSFAAGTYPWPDEAIPIRLKGSTASKLDTVFILADEALTETGFRDQLDDVIDLFFRYEPVHTWRGLHNFYYSAQRGNYQEFCKFTNPPNYAQLKATADAVVFLHKTVLRDCSNIPRMSSELDDEKTLVHESAHTLYALQDEYCCNTNYKPQECAPNIYASLAACEADAPALGYLPTDCVQLQYETTVKDVWRIDPSTEPACIMGPNQNKASSVFGAACARRVLWRYAKCLDGTCMPSTPCP